MKVGDTVRNRRTGKTYRLREILRTSAILQSGSTAIKVKLENVELVRSSRANDELPNCVWKHADTPFAKNH